MKVNNEKELGEAIHNKVDYIEVEGDLKNKVIKIKAVNTVAWGVVISCMTVGITLVITTAISAGTATPITAPAAVAALTPAAGVLGISTAFSAASIGAGAASIGGGVGAGIAALKKLRKYDLIKEGAKVILKRK